LACQDTSYPNLYDFAERQKDGCERNEKMQKVVSEMKRQQKT
jgi:hypothetical protein